MFKVAKRIQHGWTAAPFNNSIRHLQRDCSPKFLPRFQCFTNRVTTEEGSVSNVNKNAKGSMNFGIIGMEIYFPSTYVSQKDLEVYDKLPKGKMTVQQMQIAMGGVNDREDVNSISLTCIHNLLEKYNLDPAQIGRLEVGTETIMDYSKSVKTILMRLFEKSGNTDIEGLSTFNACYGGTNALLNTMNWMQSESYDGRYGIALATDVGQATQDDFGRQHCGVAAIAILIGPNASIVFEPIRASYMADTYDFYKPDPTSIAFHLQGQHSLQCYKDSLEACYKTLIQKYSIIHKDKPFNTSDFDYFCFHSPSARHVYSAFFNLQILDATVNNNQNHIPSDLIQQLKSNNKDPGAIKKVYQHLNNDWLKKCAMTVHLTQQIGSTFTAALYSCLLSLICDKTVDLVGKRILMFSYGSGCAATMYSLKVVSDYKHIQKVAEFEERLSQRTDIGPIVYENWVLKNAKNHGRRGFKPTGEISQLYDGTYYLEEVDDKFIRTYKRKTIQNPESLTHQAQE